MQIPNHGLLKPETAPRWRERLTARKKSRWRERQTKRQREKEERGDCILWLAQESFLKLKQANAERVFLSTFHKGHFTSFLCNLAKGPRNSLLFRHGFNKEGLILINRVASNWRVYFLPQEGSITVSSVHAGGCEAFDCWKSVNSWKFEFFFLKIQT